jgi:hypothetical protein
MAEKRICMKKSRSVVLVLLVLVLFSFISGCAGFTRINDFFENNEYQQHGKIIDFGLFFTMFFALSYLGLSKVWGEGYGKPGANAKGPIVGLSFALALSFAFAIVTQTRFSITTIFPLAKAFFFIIIWFLLWGLLDKTKILGEGWGAKVAYAIMALLMTYLLLSIATHMMCQMSENMDDPACQSDFFNWIFTVTEDWFHWSGGGGGSGGSGGGGRGGRGGGGGGGDTPLPTQLNVCGNGMVELSEECDTTGSLSQCAGVTGTFTCSNCRCVAQDETAQEAAAGEEEEEGRNIPWWVWPSLALVFILIFLLFFVKRRSHVKNEDAITMKDHFLQAMDKIASQKELAWHSIIAVDPSTMTGDDLGSKAQQIIDALEQELKDKGWHPIKKLAENYAKDLDNITGQAKPFGINEQHIKLIVKALKEVHSKYSPHDKWFARNWDAVMFNSRLREVMTNLVSNNKIAKELQEFLALQMKLKNVTELFLKNELKILVKYRQVRSSTMFGKRFWGTKHVVKRKGFPWLTTKDEVEGPVHEEIADPSTTYGMVEVTQQVVDLARELITKIQDVIDEERNVTHNAGSRVEFNNKYDIEKEVIRRLRHAILVQKRVMSEEWWPVIDDIVQPNQLKGHIHYRRY